MKRIISILIMALIAVGPISRAANASEIDILVQKLVEKKVITPNEGKVILEETKTEVIKENAAGTNESIPRWVQTMKWNGDFRLRDEWRQNPGVVPNRSGDNRLRFRARVGFTSDINDDTTFGFRLASGSATDPTSTNQTMGTQFTSKYIGIDQAYVEYRPYNYVKNLKLIGGKMPNPFWCPTQMIWDDDVTPEGVALKYELPINRDFKTFANVGGFVYYDKWDIRSAGSTNDAIDTSASYIMEPQIGLDYKINNDWSVKAALAYMNISSIVDKPVFPTGARGNTIYYHIPVSDTNAYYKYGYDVINPTVQFTTKAFEIPLKFLGQYAHNAQAPTHNDAWELGATLGEASKAKEWEITYLFRRSESDAVLGALSDSDFGYGVYSTTTANTAYSGGTGHFGHIFQLKYNITDNWSLAARFNIVWDINNEDAYRDVSNVLVVPAGQPNQVDTHKPCSSILLDTVWKF